MKQIDFINDSSIEILEKSINSLLESIDSTKSKLISAYENCNCESDLEYEIRYSAHNVDAAITDFRRISEMLKYYGFECAIHAGMLEGEN